MDPTPIPTCQDCGRPVLPEELYVGECPYKRDVYGEIEEIEVCWKCYRERSDEI